MTTRRKWYNPDIDDPKRRHFSSREPMDRRAIRYVIRCENCDTLNDVMHSQARESNGIMPCAVCEQLLPKREVLHAGQGRQNPLNIP